jgi:alpha-ribazole phosphatase
MRLILVRHPKPLGAAGLCYGRLDIPCDPFALDSAAARLFSLARDCLLVTSPAMRARCLAVRLSSQFIVEPRLQELDFGAWEGRLWQDLGREAVEAWQQGLPASAPPGGETLDAMQARCAAWLASLRGGQDVLAITHAGPVRVLRAILGGAPLLTYFTETVPFAEPLTLEFKSQLPTIDKSNRDKKPQIG